MKSFSKKTCVLAMMLAVGSVAQAAYLGQLQVTSQASQNFEATFLVHDVSPTGTSLTARLAPAETYAKYGITMPQSAKRMNLALIKKSPLTLRISSNRPAAERAFPLLVELNEGGRITVRQYNIHIGAAGTVEPVEVVAMGAAAPEAAAPITAAQPVAKQSAPVTQKADPIVSASKARAQTQTKTEMSPLERMQSKHYDLSKPVLVESGYTPWSLGVLYQKLFPKASVNQVLVALAIENPEAFPAGNVRQLKAGAHVSAPSARLVNSIDAQKAREIVQKGLNIDEVAREPQPIKAQPKKPAPVAQKTTESRPAVKAEPQPALKAEEKPVETVAPVEEQVAPAPVTQPTPAPSDVDQPAQEPLQTQAPVEEVPAEQNVAPEPLTPQEAMPTLEIMTEEAPVQEEESTSWFWYLLIVLMLGAAGFIYWRTKQGRYVDFQSLKRAMSKGQRQEPVTRGAPPVRPVPTQPKEVTSHTVETINHAAPVHEEPRMAPRPAPVHTEAPKPAEPVKPVVSAQATANVFDLVADDEPVQVATQPAAAPKAQPAVADDHSMKDSLDMARSFISIGAKNEAITLLQEVVQKGSPADKAQAEALLKQIHERG